MIQELVEKILKANVAYREGNPIMSDSEYDLLIEELELIDPHNEILSFIGHTPKDESRKVRLPIEMASMNKIKSIEDINDWCRLKNISKNETVIITPKFDGLSLCVNENTSEAYTRGDGTFGQKSNEHYKLIKNHLYDVSEVDTFSSIDCNFTYGEVMMPKETFTKKYSSDFANPRNLVAGLLNSKEATEPLKDCDYIKYGAIFNENVLIDTKKDVLDYLNSYQKIKVKYHICKISELTEELLINLFKEYSIDYEIDGLIIEINNLSLQSKLGRETSSRNPVWARAFKHPSFEQSAITEIVGISWNISKHGQLKPTLHINPVRLDGVTVSNVTGNNARFVKDMGLGVGAKVIVKRSGMVIPIIADVLEPVEFQMPNIPNIDWNENGVELVTLTETDEQKLKKNIAFFEILGADNVSEGVITQLWNAGFKTIKEILELKKEDLEKIDHFGKRKAKIVYDSIQKSISDVSLSKLQHATGIFKGLGSLRLVKLENFKTKPTIEEVMSIDGFAEISAKTYVESYDDFFEFIKDLPVKISKSVGVEKVSNDLEGKVFVFTGIRDKLVEEIIVSKGGRIGSSVSKTTTHLVCKDPGAGSSKLVKAAALGVKIISIEELQNLLK